ITVGLFDPHDFRFQSRWKHGAQFGHRVAGKAVERDKIVRFFPGDRAGNVAARTPLLPLSLGGREWVLSRPRVVAEVEVHPAARWTDSRLSDDFDERRSRRLGLGRELVAGDVNRLDLRLEG